MIARSVVYFCVLGSLFVPAPINAQTNIPLFDAHSHFKAEDEAAFTPAEIVSILDREYIRRSLVVGEPAQRALTLYNYSPESFVPFLGLYHSYKDKADWMFDADLPGRLRQQLSTGPYAGIGEIHIFAAQRQNPVFKQVVALANEKRLPILLHGDAEVVEQVFEWFPNMTVIWAHLGTRPEPDYVAELLERFPARLYVDTSVRDERFTVDGRLKDEWKAFFTEYADQVLVAIDTYSLQRWQRIGEVTGRIRHWLMQLPREVALKLAYQNAESLFSSSAHK